MIRAARSDSCEASTAGTLVQWALRAPTPSGTIARAARRAVFDWLASTVAGGKTTPAKAAAAATADDRGSSRSTVLIDGGAASSGQAAFLNALAAHVLELDDLHQPSTLHPGSAIVAAALAVAERERRSGNDLLRAVTVGYEISCRIGTAVNPEHYRVWHPTGTVNTFGAAMAAAILQDLSPAACVDALGTAGTTAAGLWQFLPDGAMSKHLHAAHAASMGVLAADLAREGFTGARRILEGTQGFFAATVGEDRSDRVLEGLGEAPLAVEQTSFKLYPCCGHTHTGIDVARELRRALEGEPIERVDVYTYAAAVQVVDISNPRTPYQAKFSYPYVLACALTQGTVDDASFEPANLQAPTVRELMGRIHVHHDVALDAAYPAAYPARIEIRTRSGRRAVADAAHARGTPQSPATDEELAAKARQMVGDDAADHCFDFVQGLNERVVDTTLLLQAVSASSVRDVADLVTPRATPRGPQPEKDGDYRT